MISLELSEAQLFRMLTSFFGEERVIPLMSVLTVCGGELPEGLPADLTNGHDIKAWAKSNKCLFTIVDDEDNPKLVVEFFSGFEDSVKVTDAEHQRYLKPILLQAGIQYITFSDIEFGEVLDPESSLDFFQLLQSKFEPETVAS